VFAPADLHSPHTSPSNDETSADPPCVGDETSVFASAHIKLCHSHGAEGLFVHVYVSIEEKQIFELL
jgi:hypothetical protein